MPRCNTEAMNLHLAEIATQIAPGAHAALLVDQAGWHLSGRLIVPPNITLIPLPAKCPELNPQENIWQFMRDNWLSNRDLQILRRHRRPLLRRMEQARRSALANHVHRPARLGLSVVISEFWYKSSCGCRDRHRDIRFWCSSRAQTRPRCRRRVSSWFASGRDCRWEKGAGRGGRVASTWPRAPPPVA